MPLSEHEQRVLAQMEQALNDEDPRLASQLKKSASRSGAAGLDRRRLALGVLVALAGLAMVVAGVAFQLIWVGAAGFLAMALGGAWAATPPRAGKKRLGVVGKDGSVSKASGAGKGKPRQQRSGSFMERMEQQWDKRKEQGPF